VSITIPEGVQTIGNNAFSGCSNLSSIIIPDSVTNIAWNSLSGCLKLKVITIGENITDFNFAISHDNPALETIILRSNFVLDLEIAYYFSHLPSIKAIYVPSQLVDIYKSDENWTSERWINNLTLKYSDYIYPIISPEEFTYEIINTNELIIKSVNTTYEKYCIDSQYDITIDDVTSTYYVQQIGDGFNCIDENANSIYLVNGIETIADYAFIFSNLASITIPSSINTIGNHAFEACAKLEDVTIEEGVINIGNYAFYYCNSLESISLPSTITNIGDYAFYGCENLICLVIYATTPPIIGSEFIGEETNNICVPRESLLLYQDAWIDYLVSYYTILTPDEFTYSIGYNYGSETPPAIAPYEIIITGINSMSTSYYIDSKYIINGVIYYVKGVGKNATTPVDLNATSIIISKGIEYIQDYAFRGSNNLISVTILGSRIGVGSFYECHNLISITIGKNVEKIGQASFKKCENLSFIRVFAVNPPSLSGSKEIFDLNNNISAIYVPSESIDAYKTASGWSKYANKIMPF
jgi:hypothetical protein